MKAQYFMCLQYSTSLHQVELGLNDKLMHFANVEVQEIKVLPMSFQVYSQIF